mgnify:CR=1 FL=1
MDRKIKLFNPWWEENKIPQELYSESYYSEYKFFDELLEDKKIITILGIRQSGKTYILYSIINHLFQKNVPVNNVLFLSLDDKIINLDMAISYYERIILKKKIQFSDETYYIFLDEIQLLSNWQEILSPYLDDSYPIKFILASSSEYFFNKKLLLIPEKYYSEFRIYPLNFYEFLKFNKVDIGNNRSQNDFNDFIDFNIIIGNRLIFLEKIQELNSFLRQYLIKGGLYRYLKETNPLKKTLRIVSEVIDLAIYKDINLQHNLQNSRILEDLLLYIARNNSTIFQSDKVTRLFGGISFSLIEKYISYLESSFLIHSISNLSTDTLKSQTSSKKIYFSDVGIRNALIGNYSLDLKDINQLVENLVFLHLFSIKNRYNFQIGYWRKSNFYIDLIIDNNKVKLPIMINYKTKEEKTVEKNLLRFIEEENCKRGIIITKEDFDIIEKDNYQVLKIPASIFLLGASN